MAALRSFLIRHKPVAALLIALALMMKLAVPAGFMTVRTAGTMVIAICNGSAAHSIAIDLKTGEQNPADMRADPPCAFSGGLALDMPATDALVLAAAIAFVLALGFTAVARFVPRAVAQLRPPLRGPPTTF